MSLRELDWRKGLFRLWLLASFIWIAAFGIATYKTHLKLEELQYRMNDASQTLAKMTELVSKENKKQNEPKSVEDSWTKLRTAIEYDEAKKDLLSYSEMAVRVKQDLMFYSKITVVPPVAVLILGIGFMWALQGFSRNKST